MRRRCYSEIFTTLSLGISTQAKISNNLAVHEERFGRRNKRFLSFYAKIKTADDLIPLVDKKMTEKTDMARCRKQKKQFEKDLAKMHSHFDYFGFSSLARRFPKVESGIKKDRKCVKN